MLTGVLLSMAMQKVGIRKGSLMHEELEVSEEQVEIYRAITVFWKGLRRRDCLLFRGWKELESVCVKLMKN